MAPSTTPPPGPERPRPGDVLRLELERPAAEGLTVAAREGLVVLVARGVPGEQVDARVERVEARHALARVVSVRVPAPDRIAAPCPHYDRCGGCDLQHVAYSGQLAIKHLAALDQLARIGGIADPPPFSIEPAPDPLRYRDRLDFLLHKDARTGAPVPAFYGPFGDPPEPVADCLLAPKPLTELAGAAAAALAALPPGERPVRLRVQACAGAGTAAGMALTLFARSATLARKLCEGAARWLPALLAAQPDLLHVAVGAGAQLPGQRGRPKGAGAPVPGTDEAAAAHGSLGNGASVLHGEGTLLKALGAWRYHVPPEGFFQAHPAMAERLVHDVVACARRLVPPEENSDASRPAPGEAVRASQAAVRVSRLSGSGASRKRPAGPAGARPLVLDLYCGAGLFTLPLAQAGYRVIGADASQTAVRAARMTARDAGFPQGRKPEFKVRDLDAPGAAQDLVRGEALPALVVLDPPRRGLSGALVKGLLALRPGWIVYVSCDGGSFSRDAARLAERYALAELRGYDLFPQTHHLELIGVFRRLRGPPAAPASAAPAPADGRQSG